MTELPEWIRKAKERADKWGQRQPITGLGDGNDLIRTDVPRLLELVGEMGEALRLAGGALDEACDVMHGGHHPGQLLDKAFYASVVVDSALAKYRGEEESEVDDPVKKRLLGALDALPLDIVDHCCGRCPSLEKCTNPEFKPQCSIADVMELANELREAWEGETDAD